MSEINMVEMKNNEYEFVEDEWRIKKDFFNKTNSARSKKLKKFYKQQNKFVDTLFDEPLKENADIGDITTKIAIYGSFSINIFLCVVKIVAAVMSGSLTVIASALDSCLDIVSGAVMFITSLLMRKPNLKDYPVGKKRMEPLGVIVFATAMFTATIQLLTTAGQTLLSGSSDFVMDYFPIAVIGTTVILKSILFIYCKTVKNPAAQALSDDHRNDILTNTFGLALSIVGYYYFWWLDAVGGIVLAIYIMINWLFTLIEYLSIMAGKSAPQEFISQIIVVCWNHDSRVKAIDTVRAFHLSMGYMVEVDIILNEDMTLVEAHDIGETLQTKLEKHPNIDRAFVHLDYNDDHDVQIEHEKD
ncbi:Cation transporter [Entamoeba marina]